MSLTDKTTIVTGAASGIGKESAAELHRHPRHPTDVGPVVAFLLTEESRWFRGNYLTPDGGISSHILLHMNGVE